MIALFPRKYKKDVYFLFTAGDKWTAAKHLIKNRRGTTFFCFKHKFHFTDKQELNLIIK